jgi:hypothetical protein
MPVDAEPPGPSSIRTSIIESACAMNVYNLNFDTMDAQPPGQSSIRLSIIESDRALHA